MSPPFSTGCSSAISAGRPRKVSGCGLTSTSWCWLGRRYSFDTWSAMSETAAPPFAVEGRHGDHPAAGSISVGAGRSAIATAAASATAPTASSAPSRNWKRGVCCVSRGIAGAAVTTGSTAGSGGSGSHSCSPGPSARRSGASCSGFSESGSCLGWVPAGSGGRSRGSGRSLIVQCECGGPRSSPCGQRGAGFRGRSQLGPDGFVVDVDRGRLEADRVEQLDDLVAMQLPALDQDVGDLQGLLAIVAHEAQRGDVGLAEDARGGRLLDRVAEDARDHVGSVHAREVGAVDDPQPDPLEALHDLLLGLVALLVGLEVPAVEVDRLRPHRVDADHERGATRRALHVAADARGVLAVEDVLGGHRAQRPDELADLLVAPAREALLLLDRLV